MFDKVLSIKSLENEELNLIRYKKTIFLAKNNKTQDLLESANIIINSNSQWRNEVINLLGEYFLSKGEKLKSQEYFNLLNVKK